MKNHKITITIIAIILIVIPVLIFRAIIYKKIEMSTAPEAAKEAEMEEAQVIYSLPENRIPSVAEINESISKNMEKKTVAEEAKERADRSKMTSRPVPQPEAEPAVPTRIPVKKEVRFPTAEERKATESRTGIIAY